MPMDGRSWGNGEKNMKNCINRQPRRTIVLLLVFLSSVFIQSVAADGKVFPRPAVKKTPEMPVQKALIVYRNGTERLVIESAVDSPGDYEIIEDEHGVVLRVYGPNGEPWEMNVAEDVED